MQSCLRKSKTYLKRGGVLLLERSTKLGADAYKLRLLQATSAWGDLFDNKMPDGGGHVPKDVKGHSAAAKLKLSLKAFFVGLLLSKRT